jgi:putative ABC transport system ATP-binding protein
MALLQLHDVWRIYPMGDVEVAALRGVSLAVERGEFVAIMGASGSGKSTLMSILGGLDRPTRGRYVLDGVDVSRLGRDRLARLRNEKIGFVFQAFNLLPRTSALENVELPLFYARGVRTREHRRRALAALERVELAGRAGHTPGQLSGGEQQRVAIARALVTQPTILLADEPTGNLDSRVSAEIMALFQQLNDAGHTIVFVTHEVDIAQHGKRAVVLRDGSILSDEPIRDRILEPAPRAGGAA